MTRLAEALLNTVESLRRMEPWKAVGLFLLIASGIILYGYVSYKSWSPRDTYELMQENALLKSELRDQKATSQNWKSERDAARFALEAASRKLKETEALVAESKSRLSLVQADLAKERLARLASQAKFAAANIVQNTLEKHLAESRRRENPEVGAELERQKNEFVKKDHEAKRQIAELVRREQEALRSQRDLNAQLVQEKSAHVKDLGRLQATTRSLDEAQAKIAALTSEVASLKSSAEASTPVYEPSKKGPNAESKKASKSTPWGDGLYDWTDWGLVCKRSDAACMRRALAQSCSDPRLTRLSTCDKKECTYECKPIKW